MTNLTLELEQTKAFVDQISECGIDPSTFLDQEDDKLDKIIARKYLKKFEEESFNRRKSKNTNVIDKEVRFEPTANELASSFPNEPT